MIDDNRDVAIKISNVKKRYKLGQIGGGTLTADLQSWWARVRGKEDPNIRVDQDQRLIGQTFMALNGINLTVYNGEALGIIGSNGAGKSTLLKLLSRVTAPTEGEIDIFGRIASMLEVGTGFSPEMTGRENIYLNGAILGMTKEEIDNKMEDIIDFSEVRDFIDTPVKRYSSGMYVKLAFSVAAHLDSEIMIMDEVLAVGDMAFQKKCLEKMREVAKIEGRTVLYVSHNMSTIRRLCDRCIVLNNGKIVYDGDVEEAIGVYSGNRGNGLPLLYELEHDKRPSVQHGAKVLIKRFEFSGMKQAVFNRSQKLEFSITIECFESVKNLKIYFVVFGRNGDRIGLAQSLESQLDFTENKNYRIRYIFDISVFSEGEYVIHPDIFSDDGYGKHYSYDHIMRDVRFKVIDDIGEGLEWQEKYYGHIHLKPIICNGCEII